MDYFAYCYLSPTLVGLVVFIAILAAVVGAILALGYIYTWVEDRYAHKIFLGDKAYQVIATTGKVALNIVGILVALLLGAGILFGAWDTGISILQRFVCK